MPPSGTSLCTLKSEIIFSSIGKSARCRLFRWKGGKGHKISPLKVGLLMVHRLILSNVYKGQYNVNIILIPVNILYKLK